VAAAFNAEYSTGGNRVQDEINELLQAHLADMLLDLPDTRHIDDHINALAHGLNLIIMTAIGTAVAEERAAHERLHHGRGEY
jgi:putative N-acetylmannosamine-6-phosphate epimerase